MNSTKPNTNRLLQIAPFVLLFLSGIFYLFYFTGYIFFYQEKSILFQLTFDYLNEHLKQPGGFLVYLGKFQTTLYYFPLLGAVLIVLELCGIIYLLQKTGKSLTGRMFYFFPFFIGVVLFYMQTNYQYLAFNNLGILFQLALFYRFTVIKKNEYLWVTVVLFPVIYYLFGSYSTLLLALFSIYLIQKKDWIKLPILFVCTGLFFFYGKEFLFFQTTSSLLKYPFTLQDIGGQFNVFMPAVLLIVVLPLFFQIELKKISSLSLGRLRFVELTPFVLIVMLVVLVIPRIDKKNSHYFHVEKLFYEQKYDEVIRFNAQFPSTNILTAFLNNLALAETGHLSDSFFRFPQTPDGSTLFQKWELLGEVLRKGGYFYYSIGMNNEALRWAYEYMVMRGLTPETLQMLIKTELINSNFKMAEKYISVLKRSIFYRDCAADFEKLLYDESAINNHPKLGVKKALKPKKDFFVLSDDPLTNLDFIIKSDSTNIFALEYKLAWLMLQKDMQGIVDLLPILEKAGYQQVPQNIEEVVVSYKLLKVGEMPELKKLCIRTETEQRFQQFYKIFQQNQSNKQQAQRALANDFAGTYWYYVFFN
ncbi:DUF6057 family protein [Prolixibacteraceae bacterium Z1-6]|uniref:DUF6057 family protein n=1 Tax=Draconibacterium aestuarii TaxID=2998507 RepID=A0A9X3F2R9_9BACT|nr:DUF6057 family protein [Prolixibacteraceae bacterium Z1-6]